MKKIDSESMVRFRTSWVSGDESAVVGFTGDIPLNTPIMFVRTEEGRIGWKTVKLATQSQLPGSGEKEITKPNK